MYATIRIQMGHARNALLLRDALPSEYQVILAQEAGDDEAHAFDLCIIDQATFGALRPQIQTWKSMVAPQFLPVLLLCEPAHYKQLPAVVWDTVDEILSMPVSKTELLGRIRVLLRARQSSVELQEMVLEVEDTQHQLATQTQANAAWMGTMLYDAYAALGAIQRRAAQLMGDHQLPADQASLVQAIEGYSATAIEAIEERLTLLSARGLESAAVSLRPTETSPVQLFEDIVAQHTPAVTKAESGLLLNLEEGLPTTLYLDPLKFEQLMGFLLTHAAEASPTDTQIEVELTSTDDALRLVLRPRIPGDMPPTPLFQPLPPAEEVALFEGSEEEENKGTQWQMFHQLVAAHGGTITYPEPAEEPTLIVDFPLASLRVPGGA